MYLGRACHLPSGEDGEFLQISRTSSVLTGGNLSCPLWSPDDMCVGRARCELWVTWGLRLTTRCHCPGGKCWLCGPLVRRPEIPEIPGYPRDRDPGHMATAVRAEGIDLSQKQCGAWDPDSPPSGIIQGLQACIMHSHSQSHPLKWALSHF